MQVPEQRTPFAKAFSWLAWLLLLIMLFLFFQDYLAGKRNPNQQLQSIQGPAGEVSTVLIRNRAGHYIGTALLNGQPVDFMLDTGATTVAIAEDTAEKLGLPRGRQIQVATANGITTAYLSEIASLQLGDIVLNQVTASVVPNLGGAEILLGMSALNQLEFRQQGNQLTLIQRN
ncbi:TIGR02281 family clan AA aspartic protease [Arsukibacterium sp.]|uniref:retropepsin-like aspartic protease family protein n=1 Tax=Arsukibacterium sp. TaxID=1977258 RepID=UPI00299CEB92|nr:TIGR02281 family clan AA aspartic protease [Arsukibacterium sp.]MDX1677960.1 TIGR02281 family clan AA aspartic protease [Arsukibacterium sp.]